MWQAWKAWRVSARTRLVTPSSSVRTVKPATAVTNQRKLRRRENAGRGVFAEFETNLRQERQAKGIAAAKARGVCKGRKAKIDAAVVRKLRYEEKLGPAEIARQLGIGRASVYRVLGKKAA